MINEREYEIFLSIFFVKISDFVARTKYNKIIETGTNPTFLPIWVIASRFVWLLFETIYPYCLMRNNTPLG